jgi:succinoglycan biosynthesis transport protein ExoP
VNRELEFLPGKLPHHVDPDQEAPRKPLNYAALAYRYRFWLAAGALLGLGLGQAAYTRLGPEYEASAQILVSRRNPVPLKEDQRTLGDWGERSEHIALIMSPMILGKAADIGKLNELPTFRKSPDIADDVLGKLQVKRSSGQDRSFTNVLSLTFTCKEAPDARAVVQAVIDAYGLYLEATRSEKSTEALHLAQQAHDEVQRRLKEKEREYHDFRDAAPLQWKTPVAGLSPDAQSTTNVHQERVLAIEEQRRLNLLRQTELQSRLRAIDEAVKRGDSRDAMELLIRQFLNHDGRSGVEQQRQQEISVFDARLLPLLLEEQRITRDYGKDHPDVQSIRKTISSTMALFRSRGIRFLEDPTLGEDGSAKPRELDFIQLYIDSLHQQMAELKIRDQELAAVFDSESTEAKEVARYQAQEQALNAELTRLRELWGELVTQVNQVGIERQGTGYSLTQIAPVKHTLSMKRMIKFWGAGCMFGVGLIAGICVLRELRDSRLKTTQDLRLMLRLPVLGNVAHFAGNVEHSAPLADRAHPMLRYLLAPHSHEAESYRSLRTALNVVCESRGAKVIQVSSPEPGDGKTTTIANLAVAVAQSGKRVLLIDADLRRPNCHRLFRVPLDIGLSDVLKGEIEYLNAVRGTVVNNLSLMTAGQLPTNPAEVLSSPRLNRLLHDARDEFDVILVDAPPLLAVSDPCVIGRHVDGLLLVVRLGKNSVHSANQAREVVRTNGLELLGVVANGAVSGEDPESGYRSGYYHSYKPVESPNLEPVAVS